MNDDPINPYASPLTNPESDPFSQPIAGSRLAGRFTRFAASMVDGFILMAIYLPVMFWSDFAGKMQRGEAGFMDELGLTVVALLAFLIPNGYLLATRGQSIGKFLAKIRIVDAETDELLPFVRVYVYRYLWLLPISLITMLIPGITDNFLVNILVFADILFIFRTDRRCIHDLIAGSKVVEIQQAY